MTLLPLRPPVKTHLRPSAKSAGKSVAESDLWIEANSVLSVSCELLFELSGLCDEIDLRNLDITLSAGRPWLHRTLSPCPNRSARGLKPKSYSFYTKVAKSAKKLATPNSFFADLATFV